MGSYPLLPMKEPQYHEICLIGNNSGVERNAVQHTETQAYPYAT